MSTNENTIKALRNIELKTGDVSIVEPNDQDNDKKRDESCCERIVWWMNDNVPFESIVSCLSTTLTNCYDILTILISIADVTTDIWVIYNFKIAKRDTFFIIALIVMILAQFSYAIAFILRFRGHGTANHDAEVVRCRMFFCILPLTPVMSFLFFWCTESPDNCLMKFLKWHFNVEDAMDHGDQINPNQAKLLIWIKKKAAKHMGFILEAMVEALPQSIIQLIAIVYYQDTEIINVISICISLLSVATKSMVFSVAIDFKVFIFNWLSLVCDFFGVFAIVSWYVISTNIAIDIRGVRVVT